MVRPLASEKAELALDVSEVGCDEKGAKDEHVVRREVWRHRLAPGEAGRSPEHVDEARDRPDADERCDQYRAEAVVMLLDEKADARHRDENADVEERPKLGANGNQLPARDAEKRRRRGIRKDALLAEAQDGGFDFGVDVKEFSGARVAWRKALPYDAAPRPLPERWVSG